MNEAVSEVPVRRDPVVRAVTQADIAEAISAGLRDFQAKPLFGIVFGGLYALGGMAIVLSVTALHMSYLAYPLAAGFALLGPFVAVGLYEVSRCIEAGEPVSFGGIWRKVRTRAEVGWMAFVTLFIFIVWMYQVRLLMALFFGINTNFSSMPEFINVLVSTSQGLVFLMIGNVIGAALSVILFSLTVVSFPLLLDRDVDFVTAMITSVRAVMTSPLPLVTWALAIVALLIVSALPFFLGLIITLPVLGHTTWHLYRRLVEPENA
jgi:uncharacterized membrane protein